MGGNEVAPLTDPLSYPGTIPATSYLMLGGGRVVEPPRGSLLPALMRDRRPVLAIGSNASPAQLARKLGPQLLARGVAVLRAEVSGLRVLPSAHLNPAGYVPWAPAAGLTGAWQDAFVVFVDGQQLARLDETEPNYERVGLDPARQVRLPDGTAVDGCALYVSHHGVIVDERIVARGTVPSQQVLLDRLLAVMPELGFGDPEGFVAAVRAGQVDAQLVTQFIKQRLEVRPAGASLVAGQPKG